MQRIGHGVGRHHLRLVLSLLRPLVDKLLGVLLHSHRHRRPSIKQTSPQRHLLESADDRSKSLGDSGIRNRRQLRHEISERPGG